MLRALLASRISSDMNIPVFKNSLLFFQLIATEPNNYLLFVAFYFLIFLLLHVYINQSHAVIVFRSSFILIAHTDNTVMIQEKE